MSDATAPWLQLTLEALDHSPEQLEDVLLHAGALAVTLEDAGDQPVLEPAPGETPLWLHTCVTGLFDAKTDIEVIKGRLRRFLHTPDLPECRLTALEERDWVRAWLDHFHPMRFGRRLWICPTCQTPPDPEAVNIRLNPGLAFGTGAHPSTALCLEWLDGADVAGKTVLDYGCGSGILAIAAAKLGAQRVWAVDIDPQALMASDDNAVENEVEDRLELTDPADLPVALTVDVLIANILAGVLVRLSSKLARRVKPGGRLVLAGILETHADAVQAAFSQHVTFGPRRQHEDWVLLDGVRQRVRRKGRRPIGLNSDSSPGSIPV
ncbi:MAG: 50S ribosomal protein L11 methyltransferase [Candidatus Contendobacter sp.]|nr:50S ribosomal protein L11 methyltransferase [Candidatus Contendobacter sp.]